MACFKGDGTEGGAHPFVWDLKYHEQLKDVTIDRTDLRVHLSPDVRARFGLRQWPKSLKKILISELVYHALEGNPVLDGYVVVPYNQTRKDVHVKNLAYVRGEAKNFRPGAIVPERPDVGVGFPFLPRGVTIFVPDINKLDNFEFHVRPATSYLRNDGTRPPPAAENQPKKIRAFKEGARQEFDGAVLPLLVAADSQFAQKNEKYQGLLREYYSMWQRQGAS